MENLFDFKECKQKSPNKSLPATKMAVKGFKVTELKDGTVKISASTMRMKSKLMGLEDGNEYIRGIIEGCQNSDCSLKSPSKTPLWDVEQLSMNSFLIKKA